MPTFFYVLFSLYILGNLYIFSHGWPAMAFLKRGIKMGAACLFWLMALSIFGVFMLRNAPVPYSLMRFLHVLGTGWLVFTLYMVMALLGLDFLKIFRIRIKQGFFVITSLIVCLLVYGHIRYQHPETEVINIVFNTPSQRYQHSLRVVAVSDIHLGYGTGKQQLQEYVRRINEQKPDLILIGGDLIDNSVHPVVEQKMEEELATLRAPLGIYMVPGNHEYISDIRACRRFLKRTPIQLLADSVVTLPNGIQLIGRDDRQNHHRMPMDSLAVQLNPQAPVILLDHQPFDLKKAEQAGIDLQFSGHTHNGQVWPMTLVVNRMFSLGYGYQKRGKSHFYVSSGLSLWGPPFRIGTQSELVVFNIHFKPMS